MNRTFFSFDPKTLSGLFNVRTKFFIAFAVVVLSSCKKESELGIGIQPAEDIIGLYTTDTTTLYTYTVREDSLRTDETPTIVLGNCNDPGGFGTTNAGVYSQFSIPNNLNNINFLGSSCTGQVILDSAVLMLSYDYDYYGDTSYAQTFSVYQMTEPIYKDSLYYSNQTKSTYSASPVGSLTFNPQPRTKTIVGTDSLPSHLRIPIDMGWAGQIFAQSGGTNLANNTNWLNYMNGLYIASTGTTGKSLLYFDLLDTLSGLRFYYHNTCGDTSNFTFVVNSSTAYYSHYDHDYSSANVDLLTQLNNPAMQNATTFVQSNSGLKTKIEFPYLKSWYDNLGYPVAINKAELVIFGIEDQTQPDDFPLNTRMFLTSIDSVRREHLLIDMFESSSYYGGPLNTTTNTYKINIARYIQGVIDGEEENNGIYLKEIFGTENGRRSTIGGTNGMVDPTKKMYLRLVYTRIN
jgi:hypothetical protein